MKKILIMRHGKPEPGLGHDDFDMPLSEEGRSDAAKVGNTLRMKDIVPDVIISSEAIRAITTARIVAENCGYEDEIIPNKRFYFGNQKAAIKALKELPDSVNKVLLVGHNPTWEELVQTLSADHHEVCFNPATLVSLSADGLAWGQIGKGNCTFEWAI